MYCFSVVVTHPKWYFKYQTILEVVLYLCKILIGCLGSFGPQCSKKCLPGFYGFGCKMKCTCGVCDRFNGSCLEGKLYDDWSYNKFVAQIKFIFHAFKLITFFFVK